MPIAFRFILGILCILAAADAALAQTAFYRAPASKIDGPAGSLIRQELIEGAPLGAPRPPCVFPPDRTGRKADPSFWRRDRTARRSASRRQADRGLGPSDIRDCA